MIVNSETDIDGGDDKSPLVSSRVTDDEIANFASETSILLSDDDPSLDPVVLESRTASASSLQTFANLIKGYLGSGILGLPFAFSQGGLVASLVLLTLVGLIATHSMHLLVLVKRRLVPDHPEIVTFSDIARHLFGVYGAWLLDAVLIFTQFGFCCVYVVFVVQNTSDLLCSLGLSLPPDPFGGPTALVCTPAVDPRVWVVPWFFVFVLLSWIRTLKRVAFVTLFADCAILFSIVIILTASGIQLNYLTSPVHMDSSSSSSVSDTISSLLSSSLSSSSSSSSSSLSSSLSSSSSCGTSMISKDLHPPPSLLHDFHASTSLVSTVLTTLKHSLPAPGLDITVGIVPATVAVMLGTGIYAFEGIGTVLPCETSMRRPQGFSRVLFSVMSFSTVNYLVFGMIPYLAFGQQTSDQITTNLLQFAHCQIPGSPCLGGPAWVGLSVVVTVLLLLCIMGTFPLQLFVVTDITEEWLFRTFPRLRLRQFLWTNVWRTALVALACVVALSIPQFGLLMGFIGSLGGATLQFIFPIAFVLKLQWFDLSPWRRALYLFYMAFGGLAAVLGVIQTVQGLIDS